jgi:streptogramin lyase
MRTNLIGRSTPVALIVFVLGGAGARAQTVTHFQLPPGVEAGSLAAGPDGALWFTEIAGSLGGSLLPTSIGRITTAGVVTEFPLPPAGNRTGGIASGPDGAVWFTELVCQDLSCESPPPSGKIGRITSAGRITEFTTPTAGRITTGSDGNLWFVEVSANKIGRLTPGGTLTQFDVPSTVTPLRGITAGPDGALWCTTSSSTVLRITTEGDVRAIASDSCLPAAITAGPDGNVWFTDTSGAIGRIDRTSLRVTEFPLPTSSVIYRNANEIASGSDGNLWFTRLFGGIGRITANGLITEFPLEKSGFALDIVAGPDGALWFTELEGNRIGRLEVGRSGTGELETGTAGSGQDGLLLSGGRFLATATYRSSFGSGDATAVGISDAAGFFTFSDPDSAELVVKVLDACAFSPYVWVFVGGLTNQETTLTVTDTKTGVNRTYFNPLGTTFVTVTDTAAFAACP